MDAVKPSRSNQWVVRAMAVLIIAAVCGAAREARAAEWRAMGAGGSKYAWILTPIEIPTGGVNDERVERGQIYFLSAPKELGSALIMRAHSVFNPPLFMTAFDERLMFIYEADQSGSADAESAGLRMHPVRSLDIFTTDAGTLFVEPRDRYAAEPPLSVNGEIVGAARTAMGLAALERSNDAFVIHVLLRDGWVEVAAPSGVSASATILSYREQIALLARDMNGDAAPTLWTLDSVDGEWMASPIDAAALDSAVLWTPGGLVGYERQPESGDLIFKLLLKDRTAALATVGGVGAEHAVALLGENIVIVWTDEEAPTRVKMVVVSSITGQTLYNDYANFGHPLTPADLRVVAFLLSAVMLGVLLFLLKPETPDQATPPAGWIIAEPWRRLSAAIIDGGIAWIVAAAIWRVSVADTFDAFDPSYLLLMSDGDSWPMLTLMGIYFVHGAIAEWLFGRTAGKAMFGCRVHSTRGDRVRLWQSCARNLVKVIVPPLVALVLFEPNRRHPGDLLGGTIVITRGDPDTDENVAANDETPEE